MLSFRHWDRIPRRDFLRIGALGGLGLPSLLRADSGTTRAADRFGRAKRCLLLFLTGGPPQHDTFDMKPDAPAEVRGELKPIATNVPGIRICELLPQLAGQADKFCIVRSVTHGDTAHTSAGYTMLTGVTHPKAGKEGNGMATPNPDDHPHLGALLAKARPDRRGLPVFAALPESIKDANVNEFPGQEAGFLGRQFGPFRVEANKERTAFVPPEVLLPADMPEPRLDERRILLTQLDRPMPIQPVPVSPRTTELASYYEQAYSVLHSPAVQRAFDLEREPDRYRERYGSHLFGQGCLLARRLLEAGVRLVTVYWHYEGPDDSPVWDTHWNNFKHLRTRLMPPADRAISTVFADLHTRGLLNDTLVIVMGEFGRTPKINKEAGRDHWPHVQSILLAGAGITGGRVYGSSDRRGAYPADEPVAPVDLFATFLHLLGVPPGLEVHDRTGRQIPACHGSPIRGLM